MMTILFLAFCIVLVILGSRWSAFWFEEYYLDPEHNIRAFWLAAFAQFAAAVLGLVTLIVAGLEVGRAVTG